MRIVTTEDIEYRGAFGIEHHVIPAGTVCIEAENLPRGLTPKFWACEWDGMSEAAASYARNYGFLLGDDDVEGLDCEPQEGL